MSIGSGKYNTTVHSFEHRCNCPIKYGPAGSADNSYNNWYVALCASSHTNSSPNWNDGDDSVNKWLMTNSNTCPMGWGMAKFRYPNDNYSVQNAQGYNKSGTPIPVYGYVTRYRSAYHNYIAGRVSKA